MLEAQVLQLSFIYIRGSKMVEYRSFTINEFFNYMNEGQLFGGKCRFCGKVQLPPRPLCDRCFSKEFQLVNLPLNGELLTYTVIHVAPTQFQSLVPYAVGIIQLGKEMRLPGMIKNVSLVNIKIGMRLKIMFEKCRATTSWLKKPRYYFTKVS